MSVLSPPTHSPLLLNTKTNHLSSSSSSPSSLLPLLTFSSKPSSSLTLFSSSKSGNGLASEEKKILLERYGYDVDADDYFPQSSSPKSKRKKEQQKTRGGKQVQDPPVEPKPPRTTHKLLQVIGGTARRTKLLSPKSMDVRPMMEVVKGAAFDILQAAGGSPASLRPGRWLDLYSGTGSVGIEALSRGCSEVHFVEMDPWVVSDVLRPNLEVTGFIDDSVIHTVRVEKFFERAEQFVGNNDTFDYISVTPPYAEVDYVVLMRLISESPFVGDDTFIVVEYPSKTDMLESCGPLVKITDRRFGRTLLAIYGPTWAQKKRKSKYEKHN
ncbi:putative 16S rRNA (guanine(966)-N(2))-methyltransferase [Medicago truncatula]|uniref:Putative 16S rRNA (Guanine(966)-N(2))-methyltransferase n=1 Tax=Medicago truncatula TaxID=3880 RepID=G7KK05_MEDTR|nr:putative rRNA methyltransferase YlbH [Medicago truncatula]AES74644.1 rRNA methyltransferase YlbH-like protein, putative [Medicago truncatula]RHN49959.1 putative 16S rRNA (guanine(966)-N(2))-methyltransferase [Medicago truncatula]